MRSSFLVKDILYNRYGLSVKLTGAVLMGDAFSVSAGVVDLVTEVPRPENRLI